MYESQELEFNKLVESSDQKFLQLLEAQKNHYDEKIDGYEESFQELKETILVDEKESYIASFEEIKSEFNQYVEETLKEFNKKQEQLNSLFGFVTDASISGEFYKSAEEESKHWRRWSWVTIVSFIFLIVFSILAFFSEELFNVGEVSTWIGLAKRFILTVGIAGFATYAAKQAADHKKEARKNRMIQMKIQSINPYLSEFDSQSDQVKTIKTKLADEIFISSESMADNDE